jgi:hypothetical protein
MLLRLWHFVQNSKNREILSWLGGGAVVVVAGIWAAIVYLFPASKPPQPSPAAAQAICGGVAISGNVTGAAITAGTTTSSDCSTKPKQGGAQ